LRRRAAAFRLRLVSPCRSVHSARLRTPYCALALSAERTCSSSCENAVSDPDDGVRNQQSVARSPWGTVAGAHAGAKKERSADLRPRLSFRRARLRRTRADWHDGPAVVRRTTARLGSPDRAARGRRVPGGDRVHCPVGLAAGAQPAAAGATTSLRPG